MTKLIKDTNGAFQLPETLRQGQNFTDPFGRTGVVNYDTLTGKPLAQGGTTLSRPMGSVPFTLPTNIGTQQQTKPTTVNFTTALIKMLQEAQGRDVTGQARLMKQAQGITGQGIDDATRNFNNPLLAPSSGTSLGMSAQSQFDPLTLSIANQQKLASQNLGNITDVLKQTGNDYSNEQDRITRAEENRLDRELRKEESRLDRAASARNRSSNVTFDTDAQIRNFANDFKSITGKAKGEPNGDNYVDPFEWMAARDLWQSYGGSDATFESNFKRYLNPASYKLAGYEVKTTGGISAKQQALIDALKK